MTDRRKPGAFTGRHMTAILVAFFAVVIAVNFTMARFAMSTFGGKVVENSYVASQHYNVWLARAEANRERKTGHGVTSHIRPWLRNWNTLRNTMCIRL